MSDYSHIYAVSALILLPLAIVVLVLGLWRVYTEVERDERGFMDPLPFRLRLIWPLIGFFAYYLGGLMRVEQVVSYNRLLAQSGQGFMLNAQQFLGLQIVQSIGSTILCLVAIILADSFGWIWLLMAAVLGFLLPYLKAKELGNKRRNRIVRQLPTFLDYLAMSVQAGTNFTGAIHHAVDKGPVGPLREEMAKVVRDIRAGMGRFDALRMMADRIDVDAVNTFVNAVVQAERTGASVGETLKAQADQRRVERFQLAEKQAMQAPVKLILPIVAFIFPTTFLIIGFPIGMKLWETFQ